MIKFPYIQFFACLLIAFWCENVAWAGSKMLTLNVTGTIAPAPEWRDEQDSELLSLNFSFDGLIANSTPDVNIESKSQAARLVNAARYPADIVIQRPSRCRIGTTSIQDEHVEIVFNHAAANRSGILSIASDRSQVLSLQFSKTGQYGRAFGAVSCGQSGALVYGY